MGSNRKVEMYVPNRRFDKSLDSEGLAGVICSEIDKSWVFSDKGGWKGGVDMGSGFIDIGIYGNCGNVRVEMSYDENVINKHKRQVRRVFGGIGLRKK